MSYFAKLLILILLICSISASATDYYFSQSGSDSNNGLSEFSPKKTIAAFNSITKAAGDNYYFKKGDTWTGEAMTVLQSGTSGSPITIGAYGTGVNPIISGFTTVTAWTNLGSNIWESTNTVSSLATCNMVTINGVNTAMGRYPNASDTWGGFLSITSTTANTNLTSSSLSGTPNWTGAEAVIRTALFKMDRRTITSQSGGTINFSATTYTPEVGNGFFIQNDVRTLDQQNEWYFNPSTDKVRVYSTTQPTNFKIASVENLLTISANYVVVDGLSFEGANTYAITGDASHTPRTGATIQNCAFNFIGKHAVERLRASTFLIDNNTVSNTNTGAFTADYVTGLTITNNTIENTGLLPGMGRTVDGSISLAWSNSVLVQGNSVQNVGYHGITFYGQTITIKQNFVNNFCTVLDDGGGIYTYTGDTQGRPAMTAIRITENVVLHGLTNDNGAKPTAMRVANGIYLDEDSQNVEIDHNSIAYCSEGCLRLSQPIGINVHDNTLFDAYKYIVVMGMSGTAVNINNNFSNNILVAKNATDRLMYIYSPSYNYLPTTDTWDYNVYARPIDDNVTNNITFLITQPSQTGGTWDRSFPQFQVLSGQDSHSTKSPIPVSSVNDIQFMYNETSSIKNVVLNWPSVDMTGAKKVGIITLQPFTSGVYLKDPNPAPLPPQGTNRPGMSGGKVGMSGNRPGLL